MMKRQDSVLKPAMSDDEARRINERFAERMEQARIERERVTKEAQDALIRLCKVAQGGSHQPQHVRRFLLGLYNSSRWPFELNRLRNLDRQIQRDCMTVLELDFVGGNEVHTYIKNGDSLWKHWWNQEEEASK